MSADANFEPGEGWKELTGNDWTTDSVILALYKRGDLPSARRWTPVVKPPTSAEEKVKLLRKIIPVNMDDEYSNRFETEWQLGYNAALIDVKNVLER